MPKPKVMTRNTFKSCIDKWVSEARKNNLTVEGRPILPVLFKVMLGLKRRVFQDLYNGKKAAWIEENNVKKKMQVDASDEPVPDYVERCVYYINGLSKEDFLKEVRKAIDIYVNDRVS